MNGESTDSNGGGGSEESKPARSETVDLSESPISVDISDALSEKDKVKFTVHTKTSLPEFVKPEFSVVREHDEFVWLHDRFEENEAYAGHVIPPPPPRPDFDASREKLQRLGEAEGSLTRDEFAKMKAELEAEYLATFKRTVALHEVFLRRLASHAVFRGDANFRVFLEYDQDLSVRTKNKKERIEGLLKSFGRSTDEVILASTVQRDTDEDLTKERAFLTDYHTFVKDAASKGEKMSKTHKHVADSCIKVSGGLAQLSTVEYTDLQHILNLAAEYFEKSRKIEGRVASDEDLKLADPLHYYQRESDAAKKLLYRRLRCLYEFETANRNLDKARSRNRDVQMAELAQQEAKAAFEEITSKAREELAEFRRRRVSAFKKHLVDLADLELKHSRAHCQLIRNCLQSLNPAGSSGDADVVNGVSSVPVSSSS
ncbi:unnamed protein product [Notodromas monacha]|uniref:Sorting nexin n=1 Tax=Notodromas monacha TaxID=399045 RepID=A0A7R9GAZ9_9CRUS|nr:unnamed protein product [Notodromas monacha]CAG0914273.1 unnamed protein product [Notodromas monacha]